MTTMIKQELSTLKRADRCDRCSAEALFRVFITISGGEGLFPLDFCRHHFAENGEGLALASKHTIAKEVDWDKPKHDEDTNDDSRLQTLLNNMAESGVLDLLGIEVEDWSDLPEMGGADMDHHRESIADGTCAHCHRPAHNPFSSLCRKCREREEEAIIWMEYYANNPEDDNQDD